MKAEIKAPVINLAALISLKEEKINFICKLKLEKQRKLKASELERLTNYSTRMRDHSTKN